MKQTRLFIFAVIVALCTVSISSISGASAIKSSVLAAQSTPEATQAATSTAPTTAETSTKHIFFSKSKDTTCDLYSADLSGQNSTCVVKDLLRDTSADVQAVAKAAKVDLSAKDNHSGSNLEAVPTPDEAKLLILTYAALLNFSTNVDIYASRLYYLDLAAGSAPKLLFQDVRKTSSSDTFGLIDISAQMSPDGTQVAYVLPGKDQLMVAAFDGSSPRQISQTAGGYRAMTWSPDGKQILSGSGPQMLVFDTSATKKKPQIIKSPTSDSLSSASWSPDGQQVLIVLLDALYRYSFSDKKAVKLSPDKMQVWSAAWSPDGQKILFSAQPDQATYTSNLFIMGSDGSGLQKLADKVDVISFGFAPDGGHIFYTLEAGGIYLADVDGKNANLLVKDGYLVAVTTTTRLNR